jgi:hypothetical protein
MLSTIAGSVGVLMVLRSQGPVLLSVDCHVELEH